MALTCSFSFFTVVGIFHTYVVQVLAQPASISTSIPLPPLQWLNLSGLLTGPAPPPLKDSSIAYDETSRSLLVFGGESQDGFVQSQTYLLNLDTLTWSTPSPPATLGITPSARSAALGGNDFAASNRHGFVVYGGKGADGQALSDVWEYDYNNQFWSRVVVSPGGPSPRWGASGGIDARTAPIQDPVVPGPNNTFYLAGGFDGTTLDFLSDIWMLELSGTLSSNMPNTATGSWVNISIGNLPSTLGQASTVLHQQLIVASGCNVSFASNDSCAQQASHIVDLGQNTQMSPGFCPAPRLSAVLVPNVNAFSSSFSSQVFLLLGTFNTSKWQDSGGLVKGEVAVLDVNTGSWGRVLPAGDPGDDGSLSFPSPREGAAAYAHTSALVGESRSSAADTIIFGGRDASGRYLSEIWLLRSYNGTITESLQTWSGFGDSRLRTGVNANGEGVTIQYMSSCASALNHTHTSNTSHPEPPVSTPPMTVMFETSLSHKILAPLSIALLLPAVLVFRLVSPSFQLEPPENRPTVLMYSFTITTLLAYGVGVAGIATSFTTIRSNNSSITSSHAVLRTAHGKAGLAFFVALYAVIPSLFLFSVSLCRSNSHDVTNQKNEESSITRPRLNSGDTLEVRSSDQGQNRRSISQSVSSPSRPTSPRPWVQSWGQIGRWCLSQEEPITNDSKTDIATPATHGFEVVNRPARTRTRTHTTSTSWLVATSAESQRMVSNPHPPNLQDIEWLQRRRSLNVVDELDYAITQTRRAQAKQEADVADPLTEPVTSTPSQPAMPESVDILLRLSFHSFLVALCVLSLVVLWSRAPRVFFAIFLSWTLSFYLSILVFAWFGRPQKSIVAALVCRLRTRPSTNTPAPPEAKRPSQPELGVNQVPFPSKPRGPYLHQTPYTAESPLGHGNVSPTLPQSAAAESDDEDDDEDTRQRRIEDEISRRDVSIVTVPKRRLWIANPS